MSEPVSLTVDIKLSKYACSLSLAAVIPGWTSNAHLTNEMDGWDALRNWLRVIGKACERAAINARRAKETSNV